MTEHHSVLDFDEFRHKHTGDGACGCGHHGHGPADLLGEAEMPFFDEQIQAAIEGINEDIAQQTDKILQLAAEGKLQKAERRIRKLIEKSLALVDEDPHGEVYHLSVDTDYEVVLFAQLMEEKRGNRQIDPVPFPFDRMYHLWGMLLRDLGKEEESLAKLEIAQAWNPLNTDVYGSLIEHYAREQDKEKWAELIREEYGVAVEPTAVCDAFYHLAMYYLAADEIGKGMAVLDFIVDRPVFQAEIAARYGRQAYRFAEEFKDTERADLRETLAEFGFVPGPAPKVTAFFLDAAQRAHNMGEKEIEREMYWHLYELTDDASYREKSEHV